MDEEIKLVLNRAQQVVDSSAVNQELKETAFVETFKILWRNRTEGAESPKSNKTQKEGEDNQDVMLAMANECGLTRPEIVEIYDYSQDRGIELLKANFPGKTRREKQRNLAILILWPHKLMGKEWVGTQKVSEFMKEFNIYDRNLNLLARSEFVRARGKGKGVEYKLTVNGEERAKFLIKQIAGKG